MSLLIIGLFIILIIILILLNRKKENYTNDEAIQNIASVYNNSDNLIVTNLKVTGKLDANILSAANFKGMIVAFSGDVSGIPTGWALCDGTNGTPDLRGRFIFGFNPNDQGPTDASGNLLKDNSGNLYRPILVNKSKGGEEYHQLTIPEMPSHNHQWAFGCDWSGGAHINGAKDGDQSNNPCLWGETTKTGNNIPHNNMPPYMVLAYVMKL